MMQKNTPGLNQLLGKVQKPCHLEGKGQRGELASAVGFTQVY